MVFRLLEAERFEAAFGEAAKSGDPALQRYAEWFQLTRPGGKVDFTEASRFIKEHPKWPNQAALRRAAERSLPEDSPAASVIDWFGVASPQTVTGGLRLIEALLETGQSGRAAGLVREVWLSGSFFDDGAETFRDRFATLLNTEDDYRRLERLLWEGRGGEAEQLAKRMGSDYVALAHARHLLATDAAGVDQALDAVPEALRKDPGLIFERARWRQRRDRYEGVVELLDPPLEPVPYAERWWPLRRWTVERAIERGDISLAYRIAAHHGLDEGIGFAEGEWLAGWLSLRLLQEPEVALNHFTRLHEGVVTPISRARGAYWAGRAAEAAALGEAARAWYQRAAKHPTTFYGQLAAARISENPSELVALPIRVPRELREEFLKSDRVRIARLLAATGRGSRVPPFLMSVLAEAESAEEHRLLADLAQELGGTELALTVARQAHVNGVVIADALFPVPDEIEKETWKASADRAEPAMVLAVARQESRFQRDAESPAGAKGLMQLMPATAKEVTRKIGLPYEPERLTADSLYNLTLGSAYLAELLERFDNSEILAFAAYNAGPGRVASWIERYGDPRDGAIDPIDWLESIPFPETRNYVQRVSENLVAYRQRLRSAQLAQVLPLQLRSRRDLEVVF